MAISIGAILTIRITVIHGIRRLCAADAFIGVD